MEYFRSDDISALIVPHTEEKMKIFHLLHQSLFVSLQEMPYYSNALTKEIITRKLETILKKILQTGEKHIQ